MKKIYFVLIISLMFFGCNSRKNDISNDEKLILENENLKNTITELENKIKQYETENMQTPEVTTTYSDETACFDLIGINYNVHGEGIYPTGALYLIFKNYQTDFGSHIYKILESMPITSIEKKTDGTVKQGDVFYVRTFTPGGGADYKFTFENGNLLQYVMYKDESKSEISPEYILEETFKFENISQVRLENISFNE